MLALDWKQDPLAPFVFIDQRGHRRELTLVGQAQHVRDENNHRQVVRSSATNACKNSRVQIRGGNGVDHHAHTALLFITRGRLLDDTQRVDKSLVLQQTNLFHLSMNRRCVDRTYSCRGNTILENGSPGYSAISFGHIVIPPLWFYGFVLHFSLLFGLP